jgi:hypothetical protein
LAQGVLYRLPVKSDSCCGFCLQKQGVSSSGCGNIKDAPSQDAGVDARHNKPNKNVFIEKPGVKSYNAVSSLI